MGGCRVPGPTCGHRATGVTHASRRRVVGDARPLGASTTVEGGPTLTGWPRQIDWSEFEELPRRPPGEKEDAQISSTLEQPTEVNVARQGGRFRLDTYEAELSVTASESWVVASTKSDALLGHEQGHYDLTGLIARDLIAVLRALRAPTVPGLERELKAAIRRADALADRLTKQYDTETDHGRNRAKQEKWDTLLRVSKERGTRLTGGPK